MMIQKMRKAGCEAVFRVRNVGAVVVKTPLSGLQVAARLAWRQPSRLLKPAALLDEADRRLARRNAVLRNVRHGSAPGRLFGHLRFAGERVLQDRAVRLGDLLGHGVNALGLIDRYIDGILEGWRHGFAETSYHFTATHGLDREGALIIVDFGAVTFRFREIERDVETRAWERAWASRSDLDPALRKYFFREMARRVTVENLRRLWLEARRTRETSLCLVKPAPSEQERRAGKVALAN